MYKGETGKFVAWSILAALPLHLPTSAQESITPEVHRPAVPIGAAHKLNDERCGGIHVNARPAKLTIRIDDPESLCQPEDAKVDDLGYFYRFSRSGEYLRLQKGTHQITICANGMNPETFTVITVPGFILNLNVELEPGSLCSADYIPSPAGYAQTDSKSSVTLPESADEPMSTLRRRPRSSDPTSAPSLNAICLRLRITPEDAQVFIGGDLLGTGRDLGSGCILVNERRRKIKIKHPSHKTWARRLEFEESGNQIQLEINLEKKGS